jgi:hypothetical protein
VRDPHEPCVARRATWVLPEARPAHGAHRHNRRGSRVPASTRLHDSTVTRRRRMVYLSSSIGSTGSMSAQKGIAGLVLGLGADGRRESSRPKRGGSPTHVAARVRQPISDSSQSWLYRVSQHPDASDLDIDGVSRADVPVRMTSKGFGSTNSVT